jgi:histidyl-tRNA synthetase
MPSLPGFRDFYPDDCAFRNAIFAKWRTVAHRYGFVEYDGPILEPLDLFTRKSSRNSIISRTKATAKSPCAPR